MSTRFDAQQDAFNTDAFRRLLAAVQEVQQSNAVLIGGMAVAYYSNPPVTVDADFLIRADKYSLTFVREALEKAGWDCVPLRFVTNQKGFPRYGLSCKNEVGSADLLCTGHDSFLNSVVNRAFTVAVLGVKTLVVTPEDLIVIKTLVGREKDIEDITHLYRTLKGKLDEQWAELRRLGNYISMFNLDSPQDADYRRMVNAVLSRRPSQPAPEKKERVTVSENETEWTVRSPDGTTFFLKEAYTREAVERYANGLRQELADEVANQ